MRKHFQTWGKPPNIGVAIAAAIWVSLIALKAHAAGPALDNWIDSETGRRVMKVSPEPFATLPYFTANAVSSDKKFMVYISGAGLNLIDLGDFSSELLVPSGRANVRCIEMGRKSNRLFYLKKRPESAAATLESIDIYTKQTVVHATLPPGYQVESINADESLAAGVFEERAPAVKPSIGKARTLYERADQKIPATIFTVSLAGGHITSLYRSTEWLSHPQFSPADPALRMYSVEGPWHKVDRIWIIRSDGTQRTLVHRRTMNMEIAGHEFWSKDGREIHYDWQYPKAAVFFLRPMMSLPADAARFPSIAANGPFISTRRPIPWFLSATAATSCRWRARRTAQPSCCIASGNRTAVPRMPT